MTNPIRLQIEVSADPAEAARGFATIGDSAEAMGDSVKSASREAESAASRLDGVADSADNLDSKAGRATGAMGALAAGFEFLGADGAAAGLESAAMATDGLSGAGQALTLVLDLQIVKTIRAKTAMVAKTVADKAAAVATRTMAAAQWVLNAALSANPLALVVLAVVALVAILAVLYARSDRVRAIVQAVARVGAAGFRAIVAGVRSAVRWVGDVLPIAFEKVKAIGKAAFLVVTFQIRLIIGVVKAVAGKVPELWAAMRTAVVAGFVALKERAATVWGAIKDGIETAIGKAETAVATAKTGLVNSFNAIKKPIQAAVDLVQNLIDKIKAIDFPDLNPLGRLSLSPRGGSGLASLPTDSYQSVQPYIVQNVYITGALDPIGTARQVQQLGYGAARLVGAVG